MASETGDYEYKAFIYNILRYNRGRLDVVLRFAWGLVAPC